MADCPDQAQTLAVLAAFADGKTVIDGVKSLRVKETERVKAIQQELKKMGIRTESTEDSLTIYGGKPRGASIDTYGDHRMAMSFAVAGARLEGMVIRDPDVTGKTFPEFWDKLDVIGMRSIVHDAAHSAGRGGSNDGKNIVLIGMRGTGKTTIARALARRLGISQLDLDQIMSDKLSLSTPDIVAKYGWSYFRDQEAAIAKEISGMKGVLISTGGGIVLRPDNIEALRRNGVIVLLSASVDTMVRRLEGSGDRPPLTAKKSLRAEIQQVRQERQHLYEAAADIVIDTEGLSPTKAADAIIDKLGLVRL
jgi:shikimate kinase